MSEPAPERVVRLHYMEGFACLGSECSDTCCGFWAIQIDQDHYARLQGQLAEPAAERARFEAAFRLAPEAARTREHHALMVLNDAGYCHYLDEKRLCGLHQRLGEPALPDACATYPRSFSRVGPRLELTGEPSCPEVARRLLTDEDAVALEEEPLERHARVVIAQDMPEVVVDPYWGVIDQVRGALFSTFARRDLPMRDKLFAALFFATQLDRFVVARAPDLFSPEQLDEELELIGRADVLVELARRCALGPAASPQAISLVSATLARAASGAVGPTFHALVAGCLGSYEGRGVRRDASDGGYVLSPAALFEAYSERQRRVEPLVRDRLELYLRNYLCHQVLHDWYTFWPSLFSYVQSLALRVALLRFLLISHPQIEAAATRVPTLDKIGVEVFYLFSRGTEHNQQLLRSVGEQLAAALPNLTASTELLKL